MKKTAYAVLILIMVIFLINPLSSDARGGHGGGRGHWGISVRGGWGWWAPWAVLGGAAVMAPYYYAPYYTRPPVVIQEQPPVYVQPSPSVEPSSNERIFIYPRQGQSEQQQADDRYACHNWAVTQTHYDPTQPASGMSESQLNQMRSDYQRAMSACLDGRGYTMR